MGDSCIATAVTDSMIAALGAIFVFLALFCVALALLGWSAEGRQAERRLRELQRAQRSQGVSRQSLLLRRAPSNIPALRDLLMGSVWAREAALDLDRAGVKLRVGEYLLLRLFLGALLFVVSMIVSGGTVVGIIVGLALGVAGYIAPALYVSIRKRRRLQAIEGQLVEALTHIANAMRAGFALLQAIDSAAQRLQPPLAEELARLVTDVNLGKSLEDALAELGERVGSYDLDMVITAILIQRTTGGNLSEILDGVAETMRERDRIRGEIRTLTAQQRFAGSVLSVWPVALGVVFFLLNPDLMSNLWTTPVGLALLVGAGVLQVLGFLTIRRISAIEI
jgi:tight adherence protein B